MNLPAFSIIAFLSLFSTPLCAINYYDLESAKIFKHEKPLRNNSYFGYSVTYDEDNRVLIVSAPRIDSFGKVFRCDIEKRQCLEEIPTSVHTVNRTEVLGHKTYVNEHDLWLGASVKAKSSQIITCAPRYFGKRQTRAKHSWGGEYGTFGRCYSFRNGTPEDLPQIYDSYESIEEVSNSMGWSISFAKGIESPTEVAIGGPAMSTGRVWVYSNNGAQYIGKNATLKQYVGKNFNARYNFVSLTTISYSALVNTDYNHNYNGVNLLRWNGVTFGYSVEGGYYFGQNKNVFAVSSTFGRGKIGFIWHGQRVMEITGRAVGTIFGAALCSLSFSAQRRDILLVGAPGYSEKGFDEGAVFVYSYTKPKMKQKSAIKGNAPGGRFGSAMINVGDLDLDGNDDVAIAAPFEMDGRGAVYIYSGYNMMGMGAQMWMQRIPAQENHKMFGLGLAVLNDYDGNGFNELAIGAPGSDVVALYTSLTSINVIVDADFTSLHNRTKTLKNPQNFQFESCIKVSYSKKTMNINGELHISVEVKHEYAKLAAPNKGAELAYPIKLDLRQTRYCRTVTVDTPDGDYEQLIHVTISAVVYNQPDTTAFSKVIAAKDSVLKKTYQVSAANCATKTCKPSFQMEKFSTTMKNGYIIGSTDAETVEFAVKNMGETAYRPCATVEVIGVPVSLASGCTVLEHQKLRCRPSRPTKYGELWVNKITLETKMLTSENKGITIKVNIYGHCDDAASGKFYNKTVDLNATTDGIAIKGETNSGDILTLSTDNIETTGIQIQHIYTITNNGSTHWVGIKYSVAFKESDFTKLESVGVVNENSQTTNCPVSQPSGQRDLTTQRCNIDSLAKFQNAYVVVTINLLPGPSIRKVLKNKPRVISNITLHLVPEITEQITTKLSERVLPVPLWIIIVSAILGIALLLGLAFALYECGCIRRKNKLLLENLKKDVRRQTIRRSRISATVIPEDKEHLVEVMEENEIYMSTGGAEGVLNEVVNTDSSCANLIKDGADHKK